MTARYTIKRTLLASAIALELAMPMASFASDMILVAPSPVYQATKNSSLKSALSQIAVRSGIVFKISTDIGNDVVRQTLAASDWDSAVKSLLQSYNYTLVTDGNVLKTVIISGRNNSGINSISTTTVEPANSNAPIVIDAMMGKVPKAYADFPASSVMPINLPMKEIMAMEKGQTTLMDTPLGQFNVTHDNSVSETDGSTTWVGHLADEGQGYRMVLSQGSAGVMGTLTTPEGNFTIENQNGAMVLIDTGKLTHAGFDGDTPMPMISADKIDSAIVGNASVIPVTAPVANAALTTGQLQDAVTAAQAKVTAAQTVVTTATATNTKNRAEVTSTNSVYTTAKNAAAVKLVVVNAALATYNASLSQSNEAGRMLTFARATLAAAQTAYNRATAAKKPAALVTLTLANASVNKAYANVMAIGTIHAANTTKYQAVLKSYNVDMANVSTYLAAYSKALVANSNSTSALATANTNLTTAKTALTAANTALAKAKSDLAAATTVPTTSGTVLDIMVLYATDQVTAAYQQQRLAMLVTVSNQAYIDSGINAALRLVYSEATTYASRNSNATALSLLANDQGAFAGAAAKRIKYGADLVYLFRPLNALTQGNCGNAYIQMPMGGAANKSLGYGIISDGTSKDAANYYYCGTNTFTHEIGHNLGLVHDRANTTIYGATPYSYAWAVGGSFGTIMSYGNPILMYFSTPTLAAKDANGIAVTCKGQPCGYSKDDVARKSDQVLTANATIPVIANFMPTAVAGGNIVSAK